jgi:hypothetical protein
VNESGVLYRHSSGMGARLGQGIGRETHYRIPNNNGQETWKVSSVQSQALDALSTLLARPIIHACPGSWYLWPPGCSLRAALPSFPLFPPFVAATAPPRERRRPRESGREGRGVDGGIFIYSARLI